ncbi:hypothetical protein CYMTET_28074 [Cymbomonas tetramitiformis]|uniref:Proline dehydrogenase n=1 Tax=Cymbomonas tetramitiformis TaxID=36881 RepID=A0AAE0KW90_9CHLO|nr:hypothetical protein CYMTET_28074 [Cymbomonas tetramitiformis]
MRGGIVLRSLPRAIAFPGKRLLHTGEAAQTARTTSSSLRDSPKFDPTDTKAVFASKTTNELLFSSLLFEVCSNAFIVKSACQVIHAASRIAAGPASFASAPVMWSVKNSTFPHFCAGETVHDCATVAQHLIDSNVKCIVDHSTEELEIEDAWDQNLRNKCKLLQEASDTMGVAAVFVPLKLTSLGSPRLLEVMTHVMSKVCIAP